MQNQNSLLNKYSKEINDLYLRIKYNIYSFLIFNFLSYMKF